MSARQCRRSAPRGPGLIPIHVGALPHPHDAGDRMTSTMAIPVVQAPCSPSWRRAACSAQRRIGRTRHPLNSNVPCLAAGYPAERPKQRRHARLSPRPAPFRDPCRARRHRKARPRGRSRPSTSPPARTGTVRSARHQLHAARISSRASAPTLCANQTVSRANRRES